MGSEQIMKYLDMADEELRKILGDENPPVQALQAAAVLDFMHAYHLTDRRDALEQFTKLRKAQADLLSLEGEKKWRFLKGLPGEDE